jgi:hypothetical protein
MARERDAMVARIPIRAGPGLGANFNAAEQCKAVLAAR